MGIILIRHGAVKCPDMRKYCIGQKEYQLSTLGKEQIRCLGAAMDAQKVIFSSSSGRCVESAKILQKDWSCPVVCLDELREINMGIWDGLSFETIRRDYPEEYARRGKNLAEYRILGGETFEEVQTRALRAIRRIMEEKDDIAVVTHAGTIRTLLCSADGRPLTELFAYDIPYAKGITLSDEQTRKLKA